MGATRTARGGPVEALSGFGYAVRRVGPARAICRPCRWLRGTVRCGVRIYQTAGECARRGERLNCGAVTGAMA